jgi:hypothetical protein
MKELSLLLRVFFGVILRAFFPALFDEVKSSFRDQAEDAAPQTALKNRLSRQIRAKWGKQALAVGMLALAFVCLPGCGTRTIFVPDGDPARLREPVKNTPVWVMGADGKPVAAKMTIPAGWYCLPDPDQMSDSNTSQPLACPASNASSTPR